MGEKRTPLTRVYRCLYSEDLFLTAYYKIGRNKGALTRYVGGCTAYLAVSCGRFLLRPAPL
jgi:hypothetical protein